MIKRVPLSADTLVMMISREQAVAAAAQLARGAEVAGSPASTAVSPDLLARAIAVAKNTPASDERRVADARSSLAADAYDSRDVAAMMIQRIVSDSLR